MAPKAARLLLTVRGGNVDGRPPVVVTCIHHVARLDQALEAQQVALRRGGAQLARHLRQQLAVPRPRAMRQHRGHVERRGGFLVAQLLPAGREGALGRRILAAQPVHQVKLVATGTHFQTCGRRSVFETSRVLLKKSCPVRDSAQVQNGPNLMRNGQHLLKSQLKSDEIWLFSLKDRDAALAIAHQLVLRTSHSPRDGGPQVAKTYSL